MVCNGKTKRTSLNVLLLASVHITKVETLRSRFGHFTADLTANCGLSLTVSRYPYASASISVDLGVEARGCHVCVHSFTSILAEKFSSKLRLFDKEFDS